MAPIPTTATSSPDVTAAMQGLIADIESVVTTACHVRAELRHDTGRRLSVCALGEMIDMLDEVKLRLRVDASGNHRT